MFRFLTVALLCFLWLGTQNLSFGQQTAEEVIQAGLTAYNAGDYPKAIALFEQFERDFGKSKQAETAMERVYALKAYALIRSGKFGDALDDIDNYLTHYPAGSDVEELSFWKGYCQLKDEEPAKAYTLLEEFVKKFPASSKVTDAKMGMGLALLQQDKFKEAAAFFKALAGQLPPVLAGRAQVLALHCLLELGDLDAAMALNGEIRPKADTFYPVALYHVLTLQLGNELLEKGRYRDALRMFQRIWLKSRILAWQNPRLENLNADLAKAKTIPNSDKVVPLQEAIQQIQQELTQLGKIPDYDTGLNLRIAQCFIELGRYREAYLVLGETVKKMPESKLVEQANFQLLVCLKEMERWEDIVAACTSYLDRYGKGERAPWALFLRAEAYQKLYQFDKAVQDFKQVAAAGDKFPQGERANFMVGYSLLMQEKYLEAYDQLSRHAQLYPKGGLREQAAYWAAMAQYFAKNHETARSAFAVFIKDYPQSQLKSDAIYRRAHVLVQQQNYSDAYKELEAFLKAYPDSQRYDEAASLLGDSYFALGEIERGIDAYNKVSASNMRMFEYAYFRIGQAYKALEEPDKMLEHYQAFIRGYPKSNRVIEALYQSAWVLRQKGKDEEARKIYWDAIQEYGNDADRTAVEDMLVSLGKLYKGDQRQVLLLKLSDMAEGAEDKRKLLAARLIWAEAKLQPKDGAAQAQKLMLRGAALITPENASPNLLADFGDALRLSGDGKRAEEFYQGMLAWHPRSPQKDRAYAGLGLLAMADDKEKKALDWFALFEKESSQSPLRSQVLSSRAELLYKRKQYSEAIAQLEEILKIPSARGIKWVEALNRIGEIYLESGDPKKAIPYFQRIYVMYGRWSEYVAKAYWQSGQAFEKLSMMDEAKKTYAEFTANTALASTPEYAKAKERLKALGGTGT